MRRLEVSMHRWMMINLRVCIQHLRLWHYRQKTGLYTRSICNQWLHMWRTFAQQDAGKPIALKEEDVVVVMDEEFIGRVPMMRSGRMILQHGSHQVYFASCQSKITKTNWSLESSKSSEGSTMRDPCRTSSSWWSDCDDDWKCDHRTYNGTDPEREALGGKFGDDRCNNRRLATIHPTNYGVPDTVTMWDLYWWEWKAISGECPEPQSENFNGWFWNEWAPVPGR